MKTLHVIPRWYNHLVDSQHEIEFWLYYDLASDLFYTISSQKHFVFERCDSSNVIITGRDVSFIFTSKRYWWFWCNNHVIRMLYVGGVKQTWMKCISGAPFTNHCLTGINGMLEQWHLKPFYIHGLNLIPAYISNYMPNKMWDEITYLFPNFSGVTIEGWEWISNFIPHFIMGVITYPCWY